LLVSAKAVGFGEVFVRPHETPPSRKPQRLPQMKAAKSTTS
jgi:hypothetical protein